MRVVLIDDHALVRRGVREMLETRDVRVLEDFDPSPDVLEKAAGLEPDVLILDLAMPGAGGLALLKEWKTLRPEVPVLVLSMHVEEPWAGWALSAGADGYLSKSSAPQELVSALREILDGGRPLCAEVQAVLERSMADCQRPKLTPRELDILRQVCQGATIAQLAQHFVISHNTAKTHLHSLYRKMKVSDRAQLLIKAQELRLESHLGRQFS